MPLPQHHRAREDLRRPQERRRAGEYLRGRWRSLPHRQVLGSNGADARTNPGKISYAGSTPGTAQHLGWEVIKRQTTLGFAAMGQNQADNSAIKEKITEAAKKSFKPEFLNRLDDLVVFRMLEKTELVQIVDLEVGKVVDRLSVLRCREQAPEIRRRKPPKGRRRVRRLIIPHRSPVKRRRAARRRFFLPGGSSPGRDRFSEFAKIMVVEFQSGC